MSFIERNKAWVLPLLGVAAVGVIYMNVQMLGPSAKKAAAPEPSPGGAAPAAPLVATLPPPPPPPTAPAKPGTPDLWSDLRALEEPWAGLNQPEALLAQGATALKGEALHPSEKAIPLPPPLHVPEPRMTPMSGPSASASSAPPPVPALPPPEVDFLIRNAKGSSAWVGGSGFKEGQLLAGGWRVRRITPDMVEVEGPGGVIRRWINPLKARTSPHAPSSEAP